VDDGIARANAGELYASGDPLEVGGELQVVLEQPAVGFGIGEEVHVGAVAVRPAGGESRTAAEIHVVFAAEVPTDRPSDGFEQFGRTAGKVEFGHQTEIRSTRLRVTLR